MFSYKLSRVDHQTNKKKLRTENETSLEKNWVKYLYSIELVQLICLLNKYRQSNVSGEYFLWKQIEGLFIEAAAAVGINENILRRILLHASILERHIPFKKGEAIRNCIEDIVME